MPKPKVYLNFQDCDPDQCPRGKCQAAAVCERRVIQQEEPGVQPRIRSSMCLGCGICLRICKASALSML